MSEVNAITTLPFVRDLDRPKPGGGSRSFWEPGCEGLGYFEAVELGEELALEAIRYMRVENSKGLLAWAVRDMPRRPNEAQQGAMVSFLYVFAEMAMIMASRGASRPTSSTGLSSKLGCARCWTLRLRMMTARRSRRGTRGKCLPDRAGAVLRGGPFRCAVLPRSALVGASSGG